MKNTNKFLILILIMIGILFIGDSKVFAVPDSITISKNYRNVSLNTSTFKVVDGAVYSPTFPVKHRELSANEESKGYSDNIYCTSGLLQSEPKENYVCKKINWEPIEYGNGSTDSFTCGKQEGDKTNYEYCGYGVAYIIHTIPRDTNGNTYDMISGDFATSSDQFSHYDRYFWIEVLINQYLGTYDNSVFKSFNNKIMKTGLTYNQIIEKAQKYAEDAMKKPTITVTGATDLTFTESTDGYYYSNEIGITSSDTLNLGNFNNNKFSFVEKAEGKYVIKIASKDIKPGTTESFKVEVSATKNMYYSDRYSCGQSYQAVTINQLTNKKISTSKTLTGSIKGKTATKFSKISVVNQEELPGAKLRILDENKELLMDPEGNPYEWVSTEEPHYIDGLAPGIYYLEEVYAPEGYVLSNELVEFEVKDDGSITEVIMYNDLEVEVPDTLSSRSILLLFIGMIDIALGIGILLYVKKNKATE